MIKKDLGNSDGNGECMERKVWRDGKKAASGELCVCCEGEYLIW
jgi:hypothetical protein